MEKLSTFRLNVLSVDIVLFVPISMSFWYCIKYIISAVLLKAWLSGWFILKIWAMQKIFGQQASALPVKIGPVLLCL